MEGRRWTISQSQSRVIRGAAEQRRQSQTVVHAAVAPGAEICLGISQARGLCAMLCTKDLSQGNRHGRLLLLRDRFPDRSVIVHVAFVKPARPTGRRRCVGWCTKLRRLV